MVSDEISKKWCWVLLLFFFFWYSIEFEALSPTSVRSLEPVDSDESGSVSYTFRVHAPLSIRSECFGFKVFVFFFFISKHSRTTLRVYRVSDGLYVSAIQIKKHFTTRCFFFFSKQNLGDARSKSIVRPARDGKKSFVSFSERHART